MKLVKIITLSFLLSTICVFAQDNKQIEKSSYEITFTVNGMTCVGCVEHVQETLKAVKGVTSFDVKLKENLAVVEFDPKITDATIIEAALKETNYEIRKLAESNCIDCEL